MTTPTNLDLLRRLRDVTARASVLELADLDRQIKTLEQARPAARSTTQGSNEHERSLLRLLQEAGTPLPPRELAQRLGVEATTVSRWLTAAKRRGFVERLPGARYRVAKEVPPL